MPREIRKRGKKKGKTQQEESYDYRPSFSQPQQQVEDEASSAPSWLLNAAPENAGSSSNPMADIEAPFGYVDADVKAYFRTVDLKLREWQDGTNEEVPEGVDLNEDRKAFIIAALTEMDGKELQLATDPDCSTILERLSYSMDDFSRRVFMDKLAGSYTKLAKHRFASHVCQTNFSLASKGISRETNQGGQDGGPRTLADLVSDAAEELIEDLSSLIMDPFGSHVVRALLSTLSPSPQGEENSSHSASSSSKKSAAFKAKQGSMKAVVSSNQTISTLNPTPPRLVQLANLIVQQLRRSLSDNEIRALASDKVASPTLQIMLRIEAASAESEQPGSLMDRILMGLVTQLDKSPSAEPVREDYIETLLRDPTSSHLVEALVTYAPSRVFRAIWAAYFSGRLTKLSAHPVANYVVAKAVLRLDGDKLGEVMEEMQGAFGRTVKMGRTGVQRALVERASQTGACEGESCQALCEAFGFSKGDEMTSIVPCILSLQTREDYTAATATPSQPTEDPLPRADPPPLSDRRPSKGKGKEKASAGINFSTQGVVLLQSMLRVHEPHNQVLLDSLLSQPIDDLLAIACDPSGSRVLDLLLEPNVSQPSDNPSPPPSTIPFKARKRLIMRFIESDSFVSLVDDKLGSRIADRCWAVADPYLRERIARTLIPHENSLAGSFYGKFFARNLHLTLLRRKPEEWRKMQLQQRQKANAGTTTT
ncbi:ARM repeat-containing protein, partial [Clavulina sp. PMI_390]